MRKSLLVIIIIAFNSCNKTNSEAKISDSMNSTVVNNSIEQKIDSLLEIMTLEEKVGQMNQYNGFWDATGPVPKKGSQAEKYADLKKGLVGSMLNVRGVKQVKALQQIAVEETRLGIPLIFGFDVIHGFKTITPVPLAEAASWDLNIIEKSAKNAAEEAAVAGLNWTFAPMIDIYRDARWGRVMEGGGEDPYLGSKIAVARVKGFQGDDLSSSKTIAACAKHFAAYGFIESGREYNTVDIGTSTLYNTVLPPFKEVADAGVKTFMNAFNELNGIPATADTFLQREVLKKDWNFKGFVISDWGSIGELVAHGYAKDLKQATELAVKAGSDMDMESSAYVEELAGLVKEGAVNEKLINDAVRRILRVKYELGLFDDPYRYCDEKKEQEITGKKQFHEDALDIAKKSIVLLKNDNNILPLKKQGIKVAIIGALANDKTSPLGNWRLAAKEGTAISVVEGFRKYSGNELQYAKGADLVIPNTEISMTQEVQVNTTNTSEFGEALSLAKKSDVVVMVLGEHGMQSGEARSRSTIDLPGVQQQLLEEVYKVNEKIVLVLMNGRPLAFPWAKENIPGIIEGWQLGVESGNAIAQVVYGDYNPSGKLPMTFPKSLGQVPLYYNYKNTGRPVRDGNVFWSHYSDETNDPLYPFGYGLSYTSFSYENLNVEIVDTHEVMVSVDVMNTGKVKGKEVVQLYIHDEYASVTRPVRELKGFEMIAIESGKSKKVEFKLTEKELGFYNNKGEFLVEPGKFSVFVGGDSKAELTNTFTLK
ncbi:beta-glucosidase [Tenacibaculum sp. MAR_2009_124]|uniref:beta-glucosidase BglX n=1 Tax=Tenacibaculum sp. MAR_2009_124 TaxID=1250059 RepID=UPI00089A7B91|nr:beta-glucosidase BglX [Tenacibaculum sp. MAR_2009_124]SEB44121.1 beta-glucosidase [Tenacibaculum sp. MAR_2009_124]